MTDHENRSRAERQPLWVLIISCVLLVVLLEYSGLLNSLLNGFRPGPEELARQLAEAQLSLDEPTQLDLHDKIDSWYPKQASEIRRMTAGIHRQGRTDAARGDMGSLRQGSH